MALCELRIHNIAVLRDAVMSLDDGFTVLTGETGSGKSVAITALRLAIGDRIDDDVIGGAGECGRVAAVFDNIPPLVRRRVGELGIADDDLLTLSREIRRSGRGSCRINGALVSQAVLREVGAELIEVTAQGASARLLQRSAQRQSVDAFGGTAAAAAREVVAAAVQRWRAAGAALRAREEAVASGETEVRRARELVADLEPLQLRSDEEPELVQLRSRLRHAAAITTAAAALQSACGGDDGAADILAAAVSGCGDLADVVPEMADLEGRAQTLVDDLRELAAEARAVRDSIAVDEQRLVEVETRLDALTRVTRRHGSVAAAMAVLEEARELLAAHDGGDDGMVRVRNELTASASDLGEALAKLTALRRCSAAELERTVTRLLRQLALPHARFRAVFSSEPDPDGVSVGGGAPVRVTADGSDVVEFRLACNRDGVPLPLGDGPSGGELSRLALALHATVGANQDAESGWAPAALVLDEVDTGLGGETAARVGDILASIGALRQVVAITHRPEIAARAAWHVVVVKHDGGGGTETTVGAVTGEERVVEVARLLSGRETKAALLRAQELLVEGGCSDGASLTGRDASRAPTPARSGARRQG